MLGLAEYRVLSVQLARLAKDIEKKTGDAVTEDMTKKQVIDIAIKFADQYASTYHSLLLSGLQEIAANAASYYNNRVDRVLSDNELHSLIESIIDKQFNESYYGATLTDRTAISYKVLQRNIARSAALGTDKLSAVYTKSVPFGAQINFDKRLLLASAVKVEQDIAKEFAKKTDHPLIRWTLTGSHAQPDVCDDYAQAIDQDVVHYLQENEIDEDPKGLYFRDDLPLPPHPNCQCEYSFIGANKRSKRGPVKRTVQKVRQLLSRLRKK